MNARVVESECRKYEGVETKVVESKFVEFMHHSRPAGELAPHNKHTDIATYRPAARCFLVGNPRVSCGKEEGRGCECVLPVEGISHK